MTDKPKRPKDTNRLARFIVDVATGHDSDVQLDTSKQREGGKRGGARRAASPTHERREEMARLAAEARWKKDQAASSRTMLPLCQCRL